MPTPTVTSITRDQLPIMQATGKYSRIAVALQGAHLIDWTPANSAPVLFLSPLTAFTSGKAIRGGVPLCFPWFGPKAGDPHAMQHGFARGRDWSLERAEVDSTGTACLAFSLVPDNTTRAAWPYEFSARTLIRAGQDLTITLEIRNTGLTPFTFGAALHTYLSVSDVRQIAVRGLEDTTFLDKVGGTSVLRRDGQTPLTFTGETDRIYLDTTATCIVEDPVWRRRIHISKSGSRSTVIWNPWTAKASAMADLGEESWPGFVCVETCNAGDDTITLRPDATHRLIAQIHVDQD
jgi:glucose-6-phosphate 1-epimerase